MARVDSGKGGHVIEAQKHLPVGRVGLCGVGGQRGLDLRALLSTSSVQILGPPIPWLSYVDMICLIGLLCEVTLQYVLA